MAKVVKKGKTKANPKKPSERWKKYKMDGDKVTRERACPRCGPAIFLAKMKGRLYCGKCHYTEFSSGKN